MNEVKLNGFRVCDVKFGMSDVKFGMFDVKCDVKFGMGKQPQSCRVCLQATKQIEKLSTLPILPKLRNKTADLYVGAGLPDGLFSNKNPNLGKF
jgi:hypothetical protein